jgi:hypothetical protein
MTFHIALEQEADGRWIAEVGVLPGVMAYGTTETDAIARSRRSPSAFLPSASNAARPSLSFSP